MARPGRNAGVDKRCIYSIDVIMDMLQWDSISHASNVFHRLLLILKRIPIFIFAREGSKRDGVKADHRLKTIRISVTKSRGVREGHSCVGGR
jgi:hypothetical protein